MSSTPRAATDGTRTAREPQASTGFPPVARADAEILILGSLPGQRSLAERRYYAHPQNAFWRIMADVFGIAGDYAGRCAGLVEARVALWDVLERSVRPGSLDAAIRLSTARPNDFEAFFARHPRIDRVGLNGKKAALLFEKRVLPALSRPPAEIVPLPSTSPAHAAMPYAGKRRYWRAFLLGAD